MTDRNILYRNYRITEDFPHKLGFWMMIEYWWLVLSKLCPIKLNLTYNSINKGDVQAHANLPKFAYVFL
jgi:hypothetical protein